MHERIASAGPPQVQNGSIQLSGVVPGPPPSTPPSIVGPVNGQRFTQNEATIAGVCTPGLIVEVYRNGNFAGSQICDGSGQYSITITLTPGTNDIVVRIRDGIGQYGPDSGVTTIYYDVPTVEDLVTDDEIQPRLTVEEAVEQREAILRDPLVIYTKPLHQGFFTKQKSTLTYEIKGGEAPYKVTINWGDGSEESIESKENAGEYSSAHIYKNGGQYEVIITVIDHLNLKSTIQTIMAISGEKEKIEQIINTNCQVNYTAPNCPLSNQLLSYIDKAAPALAGATLLTASFWLGEHIVYSRVVTGKLKLPKKLLK